MSQKKKYVGVAWNSVTLQKCGAVVLARKNTTALCLSHGPLRIHRLDGVSSKLSVALCEEHELEYQRDLVRNGVMR